MLALKQKLKRLEVWQEFRANAYKEKRNLDYLLEQNNIRGSFVWNNTKQGRPFWLAINKKVILLTK